MGQTYEVIEKVLFATYTICLPILLAWVRESRKEKKASHKFMADSVESINKSVADLGNKIELNEAMTARYRIIRAADEIRNGAELSDEHLEQLGEDIENYRHYCEVVNPHYKNHKGQMSMKLVLEYESRVFKGGKKNEVTEQVI